jgi:tRNA(Met) C34 N-acetyltransferase TmcA
MPLSLCEGDSRMRALLLLAALTLTIPTVAQSQGEKKHGPDCSGGWPTKMSFVELKNAGLVDNESIDSSKTKTVRVASERIGKGLWRQVYHVTFTKRSGDRIDAIAVHDASDEECSMSGVEVFVVCRHLNPERK